ncbi:sarcosine oxidase subunit gamma [Modestobacter altitudinis]|uniref:sarcosine oxidase subunit gamma n=1 Tax=Modestobacter altitudinis TaxID=2213158 RepID=UPI00110CB5DF|nr:sarcosine oxidase subunit gamma family protein [Modestobacter altitudinis]
MAELLRTHPLEAWTDTFAALPAAVGITVEPFVAMADVRLGALAPDESARLGVDLPRTPNTWVPAGDGRAVWLGPDEWLLTSTAETPEELEDRLRAVLVPHGGAAVDVSAQRVSLRLTGERVRDVLARGCALDLHPRVFRRGACAQTTLGLAGVVLLALSDDGSDHGVLVRSSFAGYLADWLLDAALEFTTTEQ